MAEKLKFSDEHLWVRVEGDQVRIGLSDYLQNKLGEIISVHLPDAGDEIERGEPMGEVESNNEVHELVSPVTGVVVGSNVELEDQPILVNEDPYHAGWLIEVELRDDSEFDDLIDPDEYEEMISAEAEEDE